MNAREITLLENRKRQLKAQISQQMKLKKNDRNQEFLKDTYKRIQTLNRWRDY